MALSNVTNAPVSGAKPTATAPQEIDAGRRIVTANELTFGKVDWVQGKAPHAELEINLSNRGKNSIAIRFNGETNKWQSVIPLKGGGTLTSELSQDDRVFLVDLLKRYPALQAQGTSKTKVAEVATQRLSAAITADKPLTRAQFNSLKTAVGLVWAKPVSGQEIAAKAKEKKEKAPASKPVEVVSQASSRQQEVLKVLEKEFRYLSELKPSEYTQKRQETTTAFLKNIEKDVKGAKGEAQELLGKIIMLHAQKAAPTELTAAQVKLVNSIIDHVAKNKDLTGGQYVPALRALSENLLKRAHNEIGGTNLATVNDAIASLEKLHQKLLDGIGPVTSKESAVVTRPPVETKPVVTVNVQQRAEPVKRPDSEESRTGSAATTAETSTPATVIPPSEAPLDKTVTMALADEGRVSLHGLMPAYPKGGFQSFQASIQVNDLTLSMNKDQWVVVQDGKERNLQPHELAALNRLVEIKLNGAGKRDEMKFWQAAKELIAEQQAADAKKPVSAPTAAVTAPTSPSTPSVPSSSGVGYPNDLDG